ncbi:MAG TPA: pitrilysin family protein [Chloroflexota bacterium]|nr:pitrilysin family protein [Chloroflexota bacterium]
MNYEQFELSNGLRLLVAPMDGVRSVTTALMLAVGSRAEDDSEAGVAHLIEHLVFKGTPRRPTPWAISESIERVGGVINASTDKEATVYWTKTAGEHLPLAIDVLADMLLHSKLSSVEIAKEKAVIVEEIGMSMDEPQGWVHALIDEAMWPDHPLGRDVAGTRSSVQAISRSGIRRFMARHYSPGNALLVVAGHADPQQVRGYAEEGFSGWAAGPRSGYLPVPEGNGGQWKLEDKPTEQVHLCLAFPGLSRYDPDRYTLDVLATILGGSSTSRLFVQVRERLALAYDVHAYSNKLADAGSVVVYAGVDPGRADDAVSAIMHEIERLRRRVVTEDELRKTVEYMKGRLYLGLEDTHAIASWIGWQELLLGRIEPPESVVAALERIDGRHIRELANRLLQPDQLHIAAIGPGVSQLLASAA